MKPSLTPVNPAFLENDLSSIAHVLAPSHSYIVCGTSGSEMYASYAAS